MIDKVRAQLLDSGVSGNLKPFISVSNDTFQPYVGFFYEEPGKSARLLKCRWMLEMTEDMRAMFGVDMENAMCSALAKELLLELK